MGDRAQLQATWHKQRTVAAGQELDVQVVCANLVVATALSNLLREHGFQPRVDSTANADVVLVDLSAGVLHAPDKGRIPAVALLGPTHDPLVVLRSGFRGYVTYDDPSEVVARALRAVHSGEVWGERHVLQRLLLEPNPTEPTHRELEVLHLLASGASNHAIASELGIAVSTVKAHVASLFEKFGVGSRLKLVANYYAMRLAG